jgi:uncharacterized protein involved in outer membrane biogenesis
MKKPSPLNIVGIIVLVLFLLLGGAVTALYIMYPSSKIIALIVPHIEKALARKVVVEKAGITLYPSIGVSISGLRISNTGREGFSKESFVSVGRFTAAISVASLFKGYPEITSIVIDRPSIRIETDRTGAFNFDDLALLKQEPAPKETPSSSALPALPVPITLKRFAIQNGSIVFDDKKGGTQLTIESVNEEIAVAMDKELKDVKTTGSLVLSQVSIKTRDIKKPLGNLKVTLSHDVTANLAAGTVNIKEVRLSLQKVFLSLKGTVTGALSPSPVLDLAIASDPIAIGDLLREIPVELAPMLAKLTASGTMEVGVTVNGALVQNKPLPVKGTFAIKNGMVRSADMPQAVSDFNAGISFTDNSLTISRMNLKFGTSPIEIKGTVTNFQKPIVDIDARADINLGEVKDMATLPQDATFGGRLKLEVMAKGEADPNNPAKLDCKGKLDMQNVVIRWSPLMKPAVLDGGLTLTSKAVGENIRVTVGSSSLVMTANVTNYLPLIFPDSTKKQPRPLFEFTFSSPMLNIDEAVMPPPKTQGNEPPVNPDEPLIGPLPGIDMKGTINAQKIIYQGFTMSNTVAKFTVMNDVADISFNTGFAGGTIGNALHADLKNVKKVAFNDNLTIKNVEVNDLMQRFGDDYIKPVTPLNRELRQIDKSLFGRINLQSSLQGSGGTADALTKSIAGTIGATMAEGKIVYPSFQKAMQSSFAQFLKIDKLGGSDAINFRNLAATLTLANGNVIVENLSIPSDAGDMLVKGKVGFDAVMNMAVSTKLPKEVSSRLLAVEGTARSAAKGAASKLLQGTQFAGAAAGMLDNVSRIPRDNEGRVPLKFGLDGPVAGPRLNGLGFGEGTTGPKSAQPASASTPQQSVKQIAQEKKQEVVQQVQEKKAEVQQKVEQEKQVVKDEVKKKLGGLLKR